MYGLPPSTCVVLPACLSTCPPSRPLNPAVRPLCLHQVAETLPAEVLAKMHAPAKPADVPIIDPHTIDQVGFGSPA